MDDGGGVEETFGEDRDGGELMAGFVRVVEDDDLRGGWDGLRREHVAETDRSGSIAGRADTAALGGWSLRLRCGRGNGRGGHREVGKGILLPVLVI